MESGQYHVIANQNGNAQKMTVFPPRKKKKVKKNTKTLTVLGHVGGASVEDAHGAVELGAAERRRAGQWHAASDLAAEGTAGTGALDDHLERDSEQRKKCAVMGSNSNSVRRSRRSRVNKQS